MENSNKLSYVHKKLLFNTLKNLGKEDEFETTTATTPEEIKKLGQAGWIKYDEITINGAQMHFYRKPKRFSKYS